MGHCRTEHGYVLIHRIKKSADFPVLLIDHPRFSERKGSPYLDETGSMWPDNDIRFGLFAQAIVGLAQGEAQIPDAHAFDLVHCNDWQTGLVPALLKQQGADVPSVFTIHNLAYQGLFPWQAMDRVGLPDELWSMHGLEFHEQVSFIKGGIFFADRVTTVSPRYAQEIQTKAFGCGMEGLLSYRSPDLSGIVNGIDDREWNPRYDKLLPFRYGVSSLSKKAINKRFLQNRMSLPVEDDIFLLGLVGRLAHQKGVDMVLDVLPELMEMPVQLVLVGSGDAALSKQLEAAAEKYPQQMAVYIGYDEELAHWVEAGSDVFLMPSRFEPCGLNQMYSQAYGTPPIVTPTGGLVDTVIGVSETTLEEKTATGFFMKDQTPLELLASIKEALELYRDLEQWQKLMKQGMSRDFSWTQSAAEYLHLYQDVVAHAQARALGAKALEIAN
ncbi:unnamed protein product [Cyprideis torosa]|uniref:starch synthase n=1 Tax=Cyprideis torosa TaxID=163714 RepID=A0A7R8WVU0_9CRUS|nr:unnamed protein product [Cyprideis torosa]CAG0907888.1 unnamed protein product [Cyprideis torosa]